jgi:hypothetical protein
LNIEIGEPNKIHTQNLTQTSLEEIDIENEFQIQPLNEAYQKYYDTIVSIILGDSENEEDDEKRDDELFMVYFFKPIFT